MEQTTETSGKRPWRYRLALVNERKGKKVFSFSMPVWVVALLAGLLAVLTGLLTILIVVRTPLKNYLPGYLNVTERSEMMGVVMRLDSLERETRLRSAYLQDLIATLRQTSVVDTIATYDSAVVRFGDALPAASEADSAFRRRYEHRERFSLTGLAAEGTKDPIFLAPAPGTWTGDTLRLVREATVLSPFEGTVLCADYLMGEGYRLVVQHADGYIAVLSRLSSCVVGSGSTVRAGAALGTAGAQLAEADRWMSLQMWYKGLPIDLPSVIQM